MVRAVLETGIPIDRVAGVSIGAFMGALYSQEKDIAKVTIKARSFSMKMAQKWRMVLDLTYPYTSMMTGFGFNALIEEIFGETQIEDLWLPYFTVTTDISISSMKTHESGSVWRYVRASMSLAGYMPPLCDPLDGHYLLDGGYTNNLPADIMKNKGARHILAVDVGSLDDIELHNYGDHLSGWQMFWAKFNPFASVPNILSQTEIQVRLAYVSCVRHLEMIKTADYVDYIRPPIDKYGMLQFELFDDIKDVGYYHGQTYFSGLKKAGQLWFTHSGPKSKDRRRGSADILFESHETTSVRVRHGSYSYSRFTDLAEMVCRVRDNTPERDLLGYSAANVDVGMEHEEESLSLSDPDSEDILSDSDLIDQDMDTEGESGFLSQLTQSNQESDLFRHSQPSVARSRASSHSSRPTRGTDIRRNISSGSLGLMS